METTEKKWYQRKGWIIFLLILFWPVGLYQLWKSSDFAKNTKVILTSIIALIIIIHYTTKSNNKTPSPSDKNTTINDSINTAKLARSFLKHKQEDSISNLKRLDTLQEIWDRTPAGRIQKQHSDWSQEECKRVSKNEIWIGMSIMMVVYERGNPNTKNLSNYGNGNEWQYGWEDYNPSYFYCGDNGIVTAFN